jgi:hypothetical protein
MRHLFASAALLGLCSLATADLTHYVPVANVEGADGPDITMTVRVDFFGQVQYDIPAEYRGTGGFPVVHAYEMIGSAGQMGTILGFDLSCGETTLYVPSTGATFWQPNDIPMPGETLTMNENLVCGAGSPFDPVLPTGLPYSIVIESATVDEVDLGQLDEIAVFDGELCVGLVSNPDTYPLQMIAWEGSTEPDLQGFSSGNSMTFKFYEYDAGEVFTATALYSTGDGTFGFGAYSAVALGYSSLGMDLPASLGFDEDDQYVLDVSAYVTGDATGFTLSVSSGTNLTSSVAGQTATIMAASNWNGTESLTFTLSNGITDLTDTVEFTVNAVNDAPVADAQSVTTDEDTALAITLTGNDADGDELTFTVQSGPAHGSYADGSYTPDADYNGDDSFTFVANDGTVDSEPATVSITVNAVNDAPVADAQSVTTDEDTALAITLTGNDADGDDLTFTVQSGPEHGSYADGIYTPDADYYGDDSFTFVANDGTVDSEPATVSITVNYQPHFTAVEATGLPYSLIVTDAKINQQSLQSGDEIGFFDGELCVGMVRVNGDWPLDATVWEVAEDLGLPGFISGHMIAARLWSQAGDLELDVTEIEMLDGDGSYGSGSFSALSLTALQEISFSLPLQAYYFELISFPLNLASLAVEDHFAELASLSIVYESSGDIYLPSWGINSIGDINLAEGYRVFCTEAEEIQLNEVPLFASYQVDLMANRWNWIGYPYLFPMPVQEALGEYAEMMKVRSGSRHLSSIQLEI